MPNDATSQTMTPTAMLDLAAIVLSTTSARLSSLVATVPDDSLRRRPLVAEWSPYEVLHHLLDCERLVFPPRFRALLEGATRVADLDQNAMVWDDGRAASDLVEEFGRLRTGTLELIAGLTPDDLNRQATHSALGLVTLGQMLHYFPAHDLTHLIQIERALIQPFLPGVGPWEGGVEDMLMR